MKKQPGKLFAKFGKETLDSLTREVKETIATGFNLPGRKTFTAAELWNIQRQGKRMTQHRFIF